MKKKYTSNGKVQISLNIYFSDTAYKHITFTSKTDGSSVYYTDDEETQKALEKHPKYGVLFSGKEVAEPKPAPAPKKAEAKISTYTANCLDDAKDYLADRFGASRTKMRSAKAIQEIAKAHNIVIEGPDFK